MEPTAIIWPMAAQVFLFFGIAIALGLSRARDVNSGRVGPQDSALDYDVWPDHSRQIANSYRNQLEMPLLFYLVCVLALITRTVDHVFVYLAWAYVGLRVIHAAIHLASSRVASLFFMSEGLARHNRPSHQGRGYSRQELKPHRNQDDEAE